MLAGITGGDGDGRFGAVGENDNTVTGRIGFWFFGKSLCDGGNVLRVRKTVRASPSLSFGFIADDVVDVREDFLELSAKKLSNEGSREVEDEDLWGVMCVSSHPEQVIIQPLPFPSPKPSYSVPEQNRYHESRNSPRRKKSWQHR